MSNFRTIIVPEAVKVFLAEEPSVLQVTESVKQIINSCPINIQTLCDQYENHFKNRVELPKDIPTVVANLKTKLEQLSEPEFSGDNDEG